MIVNEEKEVISSVKKMAASRICADLASQLGVLYLIAYPVGKDYIEYLLELSQDGNVPKEILFMNCDDENKKLILPDDDKWNGSKILGNKDRKKLQEKLDKVDWVLFSQIIHKQYDNVTEKELRNLTGKFDLSTLGKISGRFDKRGKVTFQKLQAISSNINEITYEEWTKSLLNIVEVRNTIVAHSGDTTLAVLCKEEFLTRLLECQKFSELITITANKCYLEGIKEEITIVQEQLNMPVISLDSFEDSGYDYSELRKMFRMRGLECKNFDVLAPSKEYLDEIIRSYKDESVGLSMAEMPIKEVRLNNLLHYMGGTLDTELLTELLMSHQIVLDMSILLDELGRKFINNVIVPVVEKLSVTYGKIELVVEATQRYHLLKKVEEYHEHEKRYRQMLAAGLVNGENGFGDKYNELKRYNNAYIFLADFLTKQCHMIKYVGIPSIYKNDTTAMKDFIEQNGNIRTCVMTMGVSELPLLIDKQSMPMCCVARVRRDVMNKKDGVSIQIFKEFLPLRDEVEISIIRRDKKHIEQLPSNELVEVQEKNDEVEKNFEIKKLSEERIRITETVNVGSVLYLGSGERITISKLLVEDGQIAEGGEGQLFLTDREGYVAKIYHTKENNYKLTKGRKDKLEYMILNSVNIKGVCWPTELLYNGKREFVGYLMPLAPHGAIAFSRSVLQIGKPTIRNEILVGWNRRDLVNSARAVAEVMAKLHANGILMGDINPGNFLINPKDASQVFCVDCDSYQIGGYVCPVGTVDFTHPGTASRLGITGDLHFDSFLRTEEEEDFVLAMLIFQILFLNEYPFTVKGKTPAEAMKERVFPYNNEKNKVDVPDGDSWMIWKNLPHNICKAFEKVFKHWEHVSAEQWVKLLDAYAWNIDNKGFSTELAPVKYHEYNPENPIFRDLICDVCHIEFNVHKDNWILKSKNTRKLCGKCNSRRAKWQLSTETQTCQNCGKLYESNLWEGFMNELFGDALLCGECRRPQVHCSLCDTDFEISFEHKKRIEESGEAPICLKCGRAGKLITFCRNCGTEFELRKGKLNEMYKEGAIYCHTCEMNSSVSVKCESCGRDMLLRKGTILSLKKRSNSIRCIRCRNNDN